MKTKEKFCPKCGAELVDAKAKICPACGQKIGKPIFKKWWFWVIIGVVVIGFASSGNTATDPTDDISNTTNTTTNIPTNDTSKTQGSSTSCVHTWEIATCTAPKTCSKCKTTEGSALGHTTSSGVCSRCNKKFSDWVTGEYTDEFNQTTGKKFMYVESTGTFSNSATTDSKLTAVLQIDKDRVGIMLWEYGRNLVKGIYDYEYYSISILDESGSKHTFKGTLYEGGTKILFNANDRDTILNLVRNNNNLKIHITRDKFTTTKYLFAIQTSGFAETYGSINQ